MTTPNYRTRYDWSKVIDPITDVEVFDWIVALRSGIYKQGEGLLKSEFRGVTSYCCLGVLEEKVKCSENSYLLANGLGSSYFKLPKELQDKLTEMNDRGCSFEYIADFLERGFFGLH